mmetsp:Transcript_16256/g.49506  ORF Transcript_16256/g.49506 Transcript_16256/m.49506 type:complete len:114 (+) Transcript_16256:59-400(+)
MLQATVPKGAGPGDHIPVIHPDTGVHYTVTVPAGFSAGQTFHFTTEPIALAQPLPAPPAPVLPAAAAPPPVEVHHHYHHNHGTPTMIDRSDPEYIDDADEPTTTLYLQYHGGR